MFTVKVYDHEENTCQLYQAEGVRRQFLGDNTSEIAIQEQIGNAGTWTFVRVRPVGWRTQHPDRPDGTDPFKYFHEVIVENMAGKTTEIFRP